jgi:uncharacterized membrane protein (UPF0127 family)
VSARPHFLEPLLTSGASVYHLVNQRTGVIVAQELELAADSKTRNRGLLGRSGLADGSALIIAPCNAVHTFFMRFTIDVVFVDRQGHVLKLCHHLKPWRIGVGVRGFAAIELAAGAIDRSQIVAGDRLTMARN